MPGAAGDLRKVLDQRYVREGEREFRLFTYDHRNSGQTTIVDEPCCMEDFADDAAALLEAMIPHRLPVYICGVSFGGMVAQHLAIRRPELVKKLVLCACGAGGDATGPWPMEEWYAPEVTVEERILKRICQTNITRTTAWMERNPAEWNALVGAMYRDENIGQDTPLRQAGIRRQLEACSKHNTLDRLADLKMPILCCGSSADGVTPPEVVEDLARSIGSNCETNLDFSWGHAFLAADLTAMPFIANWIREPVDENIIVPKVHSSDEEATNQPRPDSSGQELFDFDDLPEVSEQEK